MKTCSINVFLLIEANRTEPTLDDVACAFNKFKINISDLEEFINWVDTPDFELSSHNKAAKLSCDSDELFDPEQLSLFHKSKSKPTKSYWDHLGYCADPTNKELLERESDEDHEHVYDYLPLMTRPTTAPIVPPPEEALESRNEQSTKPDQLEPLESLGSAQQEQVSTVVKNGTT